MLARLSLVSLILTAGLSAQIVVVNGASFRTEQPVSPGSWAAVGGTFTGVAQTVAPGFPLPTTLAGVTVSVDGVNAPVYFVSTTQINFLIPYATAPGVRPVQVKTGSATLDGTVRVMNSAPGIFVQDTATPPKGAILNQDFSLNTSTNPAKRGDVIQIYGTGPGALSASLQDGAAAPGNPAVTSKSTPQVYVGGVEAKVQFSGLAPGFPGLWQLNVFIPSQSFVKGRVPVQAFVDGVDSNEVTVFVQN